MSLRFGTDGVRGRVPEELDDRLAFALGHAVADVFHAATPCVIGGDTRESTPSLAAAFAAGFAEAGGDVLNLGIVPTPAVAFVSRERDCLGAVISASHNPWHDNGIKIFAPGGTKLSDDQQDAVESRMRALLGEPPAMKPSVSEAFGAGAPLLDEADLDSYVDALVAFGAGRTNRTVILDCANGASSELAHTIFGRVGISVRALHVDPDGRNINEACGSTHPESLISAVRAERDASAIGFAFDGDADRVLAIDEFGDLVDGDGMIALLAVDLQRRGELDKDAVALTVMSNLGVRMFLESHGITIVETPVGDRSVASAMETHGIVLGGEQSGHVILGQHATTGDGMLSALAVLRALDAADCTLHEFNSSIVRYPQILRNVRLPARGALDGAAAFWSEVETAEASLGREGRVLVRASGTEPLMRIMVEAKDGPTAEAIVSHLEQCAREAIGAPPGPSL